MHMDAHTANHSSKILKSSQWIQTRPRAHPRTSKRPKDK